MSKAEIQQRYFSLYEQLQEYDREIAGGCTAVVALIHKNRLFLANVGDARAILCRQDGATGEFGIVQVKNMYYFSTNGLLTQKESAKYLWSLQWKYISLQYFGVDEKKLAKSLY